MENVKMTKWQNSTLRRSETPQLIDKKFETGDYVREMTRFAKFCAKRPLAASWQRGEM